jgi:hypothetical protein
MISKWDDPVGWPRMDVIEIAEIEEASVVEEKSQPVLFDVNIPTDYPALMFYKTFLLGTVKIADVTVDYDSSTNKITISSFKKPKSPRVIIVSPGDVLRCERVIPSSKREFVNYGMDATKFIYLETRKIKRGYALYFSDSVHRNEIYDVLMTMMNKKDDVV